MSLSPQLAFFAGIDPVITVRHSDRRRNHMSKRGPSYLRRVIRMASTNTVVRNP
ncbi:transposase [Oscillibacter sp.]|uniref:transposase n=1 Tax=Oscillibacter sp. TaxID=1945593 RepID=UPI003391F703